MTEHRETAKAAPLRAQRSSLAPGVVFADRYRLIRRLGSGGMAEVFEVEHQLTKRRLALKLLHADSLSNPRSVERFYREASACANIDSDHIVQIIDCDVDKATDIPFLVMELLQGEDLARYIARQWEEGVGIPPSSVTAMLKQVASALDKVHAQGIVHRDLKPANLFVTFPDDGPPRVKILDFGVAAHLQSEGATSSPGRVGTPLYMAAEQITHRSPISAATDVTAVALIAFEMLVGHAYWQGLSAAAIFARVPDASTHPPPSALAAQRGINLPPGFDAWMLRCLDPDPSLRPISVSVAVGELMRVYDPRATQPPIGAAPPTKISGVKPAGAPTRAPRAVPVPRAPTLGASQGDPLPARTVAPRAPRPSIPRASAPSRPPIQVPPPGASPPAPSSPPESPPTLSVDEEDPAPIEAVREVVVPAQPPSDAMSDVTITRPRKVRSRLRRPVDDPDEALYSAPTRKLPAFRMPGSESTAEARPLAIPAPQPAITEAPPAAPATAAPEVIAEAAPEVIAEAAPEVIAEVVAEAAPEVIAEAPASPPRRSAPPPPPARARSTPPPPPTRSAAPPGEARREAHATPKRAEVASSGPADFFEPLPAPLDAIDHEAETPMSPELSAAPPLELADSLSANIDAALATPEAPSRRRRVPKTLERAKTLILPVFEARPAIPGWVLAVATLGTMVLAATAAWVLLRDPRPRPPVARAMTSWRGPTAAERNHLTAVAATFSRALLDRRGDGGGFGEGANAPPSGMDTARAFTALLASHRAGATMEPRAQLEVLLALDRARVQGNWTEPEGATLEPTVEATAWALIAYARLDAITHAETARARVRVARRALIAAQREDGSFPQRPDPAHVTSRRATLRAAWALMEAADARDDAAVTSARQRALRWIRRELGDARSPLRRDAALTAQAGYILARTHGTRDAADDDHALIGSLARTLFEWCSATPLTHFECARPPGDDGTGIDPWRPWMLLALDRWSRDRTLGARDDAQAARLIRATVARLASDQAELARRPTEVLAIYTLATAALRGE